MRICPECGGADCEARFHELLALEFELPEYGAVHHLTVTAYMVQHSSRLSREGWLFERQLLEVFVERATDPRRVRRAHEGDVDSGRRAFKLKSIDGRPLFTGVSWGRTVRDVRQDPAEAYPEDVTAWARQTLLDSQQVLMETHES